MTGFTPEHAERMLRDAEAATQGEWVARVVFPDSLEPGMAKWVVSFPSDGDSTVLTEANARHIANCSPGVIVALLHKCEALRTGMETNRDAYEEAEGVLEAALEAERVTSKALRAEVERLKAEVQARIKERDAEASVVNRERRKAKSRATRAKKAAAQRDEDEKRTLCRHHPRYPDCEACRD